MGGLEKIKLKRGGGRRWGRFTEHIKNTSDNKKIINRINKLI